MIAGPGTGPDSAPAEPRRVRPRTALTASARDDRDDGGEERDLEGIGGFLRVVVGSPCWLPGGTAPCESAGRGRQAPLKGEAPSCPRPRSPGGARRWARGCRCSNRRKYPANPRDGCLRRPLPSAPPLVTAARGRPRGRPPARSRGRNPPRGGTRTGGVPRRRGTRPRRSSSCAGRAPRRAVPRRALALARRGAARAEPGRAPVRRRGRRAPVRSGRPCAVPRRRVARVLGRRRLRARPPARSPLVAGASGRRCCSPSWPASFSGGGRRSSRRRVRRRRTRSCTTPRSSSRTRSMCSSPSCSSSSDCQSTGSRARSGRSSTAAAGPGHLCAFASVFVASGAASRTRPASWAGRGGAW